MGRNVIAKTRISKHGLVWRIDYYAPYSGYLLTYAATWEEAMREACVIEEYRQWI